jgi:hypothetical protein
MPTRTEINRAKLNDKQSHAIYCTFERIILLRTIPYWLYWPLVGMAFLILGEVFAQSINDPFFFWPRAIFAFGLATVPTVHIWLCHSFDDLMQDLFSAVLKKGKLFEDWLISSKENAFTLQSRTAKLVTGVVIAFGLSSVSLLGPPFGVPFYNTLGLLIFTLFLYICGQSLYIAIALLFLLARIVRLPINVPFSLMPAPTLSKLQNYYLTLGCSILLFYIALALAVWQGPYGIQPLLLVWLIVLSLYPLGIFFASILQIHVLRRAIKYNHLHIINDQIQRAMTLVASGTSGKTLDRLEKLIHIQDILQRMKEW